MRYAESSIDINRVIRMLLVHDTGEIDTGDTMVFAEGGREESKAAELAAVMRIFGILPEDQGADVVFRITGIPRDHPLPRIAGLRLLQAGTHLNQPDCE